MSNSILERILVNVDFNPESVMAIKHAVDIAIHSNKEINLVHIVDSKNYPGSEPLFKDHAKIMMQDMVNHLTAEYNIPINAYVLEGNRHQLMTDVAERSGSALVIIGLNKKTKVTVPMLKMTYPSRVPYIFVRQDPVPNNYQHILFPIDPSHQTKEKVFWAVFFSKFFGSTIHITLAKPKNKELDRQLSNNLIFTKGIFQSWQVNFKTHSLVGNSFDIHTLCKPLVQELNTGLMIMMNTKHFGLFDYLLGPYEQKILNSSHSPIMCVNSRDDLYVPCI